MNFEVFAFLPPEGHVLRIYSRHGQCEFLIGFCRGLLLSGQHIHFINSFHRASNAAMTLTWAAPCSPEPVLLVGYSFDLCEEQPWMALAGPDGPR